MGHLVNGARYSVQMSMYYMQTEMRMIQDPSGFDDGRYIAYDVDG